MSLDIYNLKLQRVPLALEDKFLETVPERGEPHWRIKKYYLSIGDGATKGGYALASKNWVLNAIKWTEITGSIKGLSPN